MTNFQDVDKIRPQSLAYIKEWQRLQEQRQARLTSFGCLPIGAKFTLPGGRCQQVKLSCNQALAGGYVVSYWSWERVASV